MPDGPATNRIKCSREDAIAVLRRLREVGHIAYFAGGCVRDMLLGRKPKDFDVATDAPPQRVRELFTNTQAVGAAFGVILVRHRKSQVEVATFRSDGEYRDGRHPSEVRFTTAEEDAKRRDFTLNGLFLDPLNGQVIDYVGGQEDLKAGRIRAIGEPAKRFDEDSLRLLRAVRFSARFGFPIEPVTSAAIIEHAPQLKRVSPERIAEELRIMLTAATKDRAWRMLWDLGLLRVIFRFLRQENTVEPEGAFLFDQVQPSEPAPFGLALAAGTLCFRMRTERPQDPRTLLEKREIDAAVRAMRQALRISNEESDEMRGTLAALGPLLAGEPPSIARLKRFLAEPTATLSRALLDALAAAGLFREQIDRLRAELSIFEKTEFAPPPLLNGDVLTQLGLTPGPMFKRILDAVYDAQLEERVTTPEEAQALALRLARD